MGNEELLKRATIEANGWASAADRLPTSDPGHLGVLPEAAAIVRALSAALRAEHAAHEATRRELAEAKLLVAIEHSACENALALMETSTGTCAALTAELEKARAELAASQTGSSSGGGKSSGAVSSGSGAT